MKFLSFTTLLDNDVALSEVQQISASRLLGNATGSTANVSQISLGAGLEFSGSTLNVNNSSIVLDDNSVSLKKLNTIGLKRIIGNPLSTSGDIVQLNVSGGLSLKESPNRIELISINKPTGTLQFSGVIPPATDIVIYVDGVTNNRMEVPNDTLRLVQWNAYIYKDSTDELLGDSFGNISRLSGIQYLKINVVGFNNYYSGTTLIEFDVWNNVLNTNPITPQWRSDGGNISDWEIFIDYTNGFNSMTYDVRLVVDVEYYDYTL